MILISRLSYFLIAVSLSCASATVFLLYQYKQGIPYPFATSMTLATMVGLVAPLLAVVCYAMLAGRANAKQKYLVYYVACIALTLFLAVVTF